MASVILKEIYEARLGNKCAVDVATWLSGRGRGGGVEERRGDGGYSSYGRESGWYMVGHRTPGVSPSWGCYSQYTEGYSQKLRPTC